MACRGQDNHLFPGSVPGRMVVDGRISVGLLEKRLKGVLSVLVRPRHKKPDPRRIWRLGGYQPRGMTASAKIPHNTAMKENEAAGKREGGRLMTGRASRESSREEGELGRWKVLPHW